MWAFQRHLKLAAAGHHDLGLRQLGRGARVRHGRRGAHKARIPQPLLDAAEVLGLPRLRGAAAEHDRKKDSGLEPNSRFGA